VVLLGLIKADPKGHHYPSEASTGLADLTQYLRKTYTFLNQQREADLDTLGYHKWHKVP